MINIARLNIQKRLYLNNLIEFSRKDRKHVDTPFEKIKKKQVKIE